MRHNRACGWALLEDTPGDYKILAERFDGMYKSAVLMGQQ